MARVSGNHRHLPSRILAAWTAVVALASAVLVTPRAAEAATCSTSPSSAQYPGPGLTVPGVVPESIGTTAFTSADGSITVVAGVVGESCQSTPWSVSLGGIATSDADVASHLTERADVVVRGTDGAIWHAGATQDGVIGWESLGGNIVGGPSITGALNLAELFVAAREIDGRVTVRRWVHTANSEWSAPSDAPGVWSSDPDIAGSRGGRHDIVGLGFDGRACHTFITPMPGTPNPVECFAGGYRSAPTIAVEPADTNFVPTPVTRAWMFVRGLDDGLWVNRFVEEQGWSGWSLVGGVLTSAPDAAYVPGVGVRVAMRGADGDVWYTEGDAVFAPFTK